MRRLPWSPALRHRLVIGWCSIFVALMALLPLAGRAHAGTRAPRLILPGDHAVRSGQLIELKWTPADSISELEILLSLDGGRHYTMCISPSLDPLRCRFVWRVPDVDAPLRMRIRFNRGGREIEGAPA